MCPVIAARSACASVQCAGSPCLWFDSQAEEAAKYYEEVHHRPAGSVMTVEFELEGQPFTAPVSFQIDCETREEVDYYGNELYAGGDPAAQQCGWLKDKFDLSWQVVPRILSELMTDPDRSKADRAMEAMLPMKKIDIAELKRATETAAPLGGR
jgi:predicted 3-demethylubiquinone-9 3-methyltransferase (glyoxalase superfamily)